MGIEEQIKVTGAAEGKRELDQLAEGMKGVGDASERAGKKSDAAARGVNEVGDAAKGVASSAKSAGKEFAGWAKQQFAGLSALNEIKKAIGDIIGSYKEALRLQRQFAGDSVTLSEQTKEFGAQVGKSEGDAIIALTDIRKSTGLNLNKASELGIAAAIAFEDRDGLFAGNNLATAKEIGSFAQAKAFDATAIKSLFGFLKEAGALESPEAAKEATAEISAAATASKAKNVGKFVEQLARGGTALLQQGVSLSDVLELSGQARNVEVSEELSAQTLTTLQEVAVGGTDKKFTKEIEQRARAQGLDFKSLTSPQKIQLAREVFGDIDGDAELNRVIALFGSPGRGLRLAKALRGSNVEATAGIGDAVASASAADVDAVVAADQDSPVRRRNINQAKIDLLKDQTGRLLTTITLARDLAEEQLEADIAGDVVEWVSDRNREGQVETKVVEILKGQISELRKDGVDVSAARNALRSVGIWDPLFGFDDTKLNQIAREIEEARRGRRLDLEANQKTNITVVGTQYNDVEAGRHPPEDEDLND